MYETLTTTRSYEGGDCSHRLRSVSMGREKRSLYSGPELWVPVDGGADANRVVTFGTVCRMLHQRPRACTTKPMPTLCKHARQRLDTTVVAVGKHRACGVCCMPPAQSDRFQPFQLRRQWTAGLPCSPSGRFRRCRVALAAFNISRGTDSWCKDWITSAAPAAPLMRHKTAAMETCIVFAATPCCTAQSMRWWWWHNV